MQGRSVLAWDDGLAGPCRALAGDGGVSERLFWRSSPKGRHGSFCPSANFLVRAGAIRAGLKLGTPSRFGSRMVERGAFNHDGQKSPLIRVWAETGLRPRALRSDSDQSVYLSGAVCPARDRGCTPILPRVATAPDAVAILVVGVLHRAHGTRSCAGRSRFCQRQSRIMKEKKPCPDWGRGLKSAGKLSSRSASGTASAARLKTGSRRPSQTHRRADCFLARRHRDRFGRRR